jgi:hypothetical protein
VATGATRSPHRPNSFGLSLVRVISVDLGAKRLHVSALDIVNGTHVYDIKPCAPWDVPGRYDEGTLTTTTTATTSLRVPDWVDRDDVLESVVFDDAASASLSACLTRGKLGPLYTIENDGFAGATEAIRQVLAQDPRSSNTNRANGRGRRSSSSSLSSSSGGAPPDVNYRMLFCKVEVEFRVHGDRDGGTGSLVTVTNVRDDFDLDGVERVDGIPVLLRGNFGREMCRSRIGRARIT